MMLLMSAIVYGIWLLVLLVLIGYVAELMGYEFKNDVIKDFYDYAFNFNKSDEEL